MSFLYVIGILIQNYIMSQAGRKFISQRVKKYRINAGYNKKQLSLAIGYDNSYISKVENGKVNIGIDVIEAIAVVCNVSIEKFLGT